MHHFLLCQVWIRWTKSPYSGTFWIGMCLLLLSFSFSSSLCLGFFFFSFCLDSMHFSCIPWQIKRQDRGWFTAQRMRCTSRYSSLVLYCKWTKVIPPGCHCHLQKQMWALGLWESDFYRAVASLLRYLCWLRISALPLFSPGVEVV